MSESITDSGHDTNSTIGTGNTSTIEATDRVGKIESSYHLNYSNVDTLPQLPSHKFRYSVWHELRQTCLTGDQLHAPRVRAGPPVKEKQFNRVVEDGLPIHHDMKGKRRQNHMNQAENWETAEVINLCYQELSHAYQRENFSRILNRCQSAHTVNLSFNNIHSLKGVTFPSCQYINIHSNYLRSISNFPNLPRVKKLIATNNSIDSLNGLKNLRNSPIEELYLKGNDVSFQNFYRQMVFAILPNLKVLDGIPRTPSDDNIDVQMDPEENSRCTIL